VTIGGNETASSWTTDGIGLRINAATYTDSSTSAAGVAATNHIHAIAQGTLAATNGAVTTTNASTLYIAGAPVAGTNMTISNRWSLYIAGGNSGFGGDLLNLQANGVGNIGSSSTYFDTAFVNATSAQYADVAERYLADADYPIGTVLIIGGDNEVTQSNMVGQTSIAGTVSENPGVLMNRGLEGEHVVAVALLGRVPCRIVGPVNKGDLLMSSEICATLTPSSAGTMSLAMRWVCASCQAALMPCQRNAMRGNKPMRLSTGTCRPNCNMPPTITPTPMA
jgi:hypothetical protein